MSNTNLSQRKTRRKMTNQSGSKLTTTSASSTQSLSLAEWPTLSDQSVVANAAASAHVDNIWASVLSQSTVIDPVDTAPLMQLHPLATQYALMNPSSHPAQTVNPLISYTTTLTTTLHRQTPTASDHLNRSQSNNKIPVITQMTPHEEEVNRKVIEIILSMHKSQEYVAPKRVMDKLFAHFRCRSWNELKVHQNKLKALDNLDNRVKNVTLHVQMLKEIFNICTLYELEPLLVKCLEVNRYEDLEMGPLGVNPIVQEIFNYDPIHRNQAILPITTSDIIQHFVKFRRNRTGSSETYRDDFLNYLGQKYRLQSWKELGLHLGSFPFLIHVNNRLQQDLEQHQKGVIEKAFIGLLEDVRTNLNKIKEEINAEQQLSCYTKKKTPIAVFNHLTSIIEKYFHWLPHQSATYAALVLLRENELLRFLLNLSIYLGTIEDTETLRIELKKLHADIYPNEDLFKFENRIETEIITNLFDQRRFKSTISFGELCSEMYSLLSNYQTLLTIEQLVDIDQSLCRHYGVNNFSQLNSDDLPLTHFLHKYREQIDPHHQLAIYDECSPPDDREALGSFIQQLDICYQESMNVSTNENLGYEYNSIDVEKWSTVNKVLKHKFSQSINFRQAKSILIEANRLSTHFHKHPIVRFEESLLDIHYLNRIDICPVSVNVNENQLCQLIANAPLMIDLSQWLQWQNFFHPKYGRLLSFLTKHEHEFQGILFLETSKSKVIRLPFNTSTQNFEQELSAMNIRAAVGYLCSLIVQEGLVSRLPFTVLRTSIETWFYRLQALAILNHDPYYSSRLILEFLMLLPIFIGQSRVIEELILGPLDLVFCDESNIRSRLWDVANNNQRMKLEFWGHTINIDEWKNNEKWTGQFEEEAPVSSQAVHLISSENYNRQITTQHLSIDPERSAERQPTIPSNEMLRRTVDNILPFQSAIEHVRWIRQDYGVDDTQNTTSNSAVTRLHGVVQRILEKLSVDLFSEGAHFVLELVQNADDNQYEDSVVPTLRFVLSSQRILVCNNELGFQPKNISAICDAGASTKGKHKQGYSGHKGIGFKSVFMISHRPEIHSGNYHIRFDTMNGTQQMGYILPIWIDQYDEPLPDSSQWPTCIRLPIQADIKADYLRQKFDNIQAKLLLFLHRLRKIEIVQEQENIVTTKIFTRFDHINDVDGQIIELQEKLSNEIIHRNLWLVVKKVIPVPDNIKNSLRDIKGPVDWTTIAIAYPLEGLTNSSVVPLSSQPVFAYLPVRSFDFRFILQADFEVPSSRQDIHRDNLWNDWLKSEMPSLLSLSYEKFQRLPELLPTFNMNTQQITSIQTIKFFLKFLPSYHEIDPYFQTFIKQGFQLLTGVLQLPVINPKSTNENEKISWASASQCIIVRDEFIRMILSSELLLTHFNRYHLHEELTNDCDEKLLLALGCRQLNTSDVIKLIELAYQSDDREYLITETIIQEVAQWFICLDYSLQEQHAFDRWQNKKDDTFDRLKLLKIIPLQFSKHLVSLHEFQHDTIFFPLNKSTKYARHLRLILDDVPILDHRLIIYIEDHYSRRFQSCRKLLEKLGIRDIPRIQDIYRQHILPTMADPKRWSNKSSDLLIAYVISIYTYLYRSEKGLSEDEINQLRKQMLIKTQENQFLSLGTEKTFIHVTKAYGARQSMESLNLPKDRIHFISNDYYLQYRETVLRNDPDQRLFLQFLHDVRIDDFLRMEYKSIPFADTTQLDNTSWQHHKDELNNLIHEPFFIDDYQCEELEVLMSPEPNYQLCVQLLQYLQDHYRSTSQYYDSSLVRSRHKKMNQNEQVKTMESSFRLTLKKHSWIPVTNEKLCRPADVYCLESPYELFRSYVPHLDLTKVSIKDQNFMFNILGIQNTIPTKFLFKLLMKWSSNLEHDQIDDLIQTNENSDLIPCPLSSTFRCSCPDSINKIRQLYLLLINNEKTCRLLARFRQWPLVYVPQDDNEGQFVHADKVYWQNYDTDISINDVLRKTNSRRAIGPYYQDNPSLSALFLNILAIEHQPSIDDYLSLLSKADEIDQIWKLITILIRIAIEQKKEHELQEKCHELQFIPCINFDHHLMKSTDQQLFYPHDSDVAELFADLVLIIKLPSNSFYR
ncbi:unnamed protein product [Adineta steineri]|uniref:Protein NO VEIN C-terminal domain-containing protein n=1 Tax=Adineta steineri TaxID=433720 RepID=A0A814FS75_9BILA|nr:unnamed protein product [Adineta steineri]